MTILFDPVTGINPQDSLFLDREVWDLAHTPMDKRPLLLHYHPLVIYRFQVLKQADVVLALFLQGDHFTAEQKRVDFEYYDPITTGDSTLSGVVQSIIAAEVGYADLALRYFDQLALRRPGRPARQHQRRRARRLDRRGVERARLRLRRDARLQRRDHLRPAAAGRLDGPELLLTLRGTRVRVDLEPRASASPCSRAGRPRSACAGRRSWCPRRRQVWVPLEDQGPRLHGPIGSRGGERRPDGTLITASVPQATLG